MLINTFRARFALEGRRGSHGYTRTCRGRGRPVGLPVNLWPGLFVMARILFVSSEGVLGGAETSLLLPARHVGARFMVAVACPAPSPLSEALAGDGIESHAPPQPPAVRRSSPRYAAYWPAAVCTLVRAIQRTRPDLVHANTFYAGAASLPAALIGRRKLLLHARDLVNFGILTRLFDRYCRRGIPTRVIQLHGPPDRRPRPASIRRRPVNMRRP